MCNRNSCFGQIYFRLLQSHAMRGCTLRRKNILKRLLIHVGEFNFGLILCPYRSYRDVEPQTACVIAAHSNYREKRHRRRTVRN